MNCTLKKVQGLNLYLPEPHELYYSLNPDGYLTMSADVADRNGTIDITGLGLVGFPLIMNGAAHRLRFYRVETRWLANIIQ